jgi:hypothetical protein
MLLLFSGVTKDELMKTPDQLEVALISFMMR